jgi:rhodanese-related sulfurtransferase
MSDDQWAPVYRNAKGEPEVTHEWLHDEGLAAYRVVDCREVNEWVSELGHVEGTELIPMDGIRAASSTWDKETPIVILCRSGNRSGKVALWMEQQGFKKVASMAGGMLAWNDSGYDISRDAP